MKIAIFNLIEMHRHDSPQTQFTLIRRFFANNEKQSAYDYLLRFRPLLPAFSVKTERSSYLKYGNATEMMNMTSRMPDIVVVEMHKP